MLSRALLPQASIAVAPASTHASTCVDTLEMELPLVRAAEYTLHVVLTVQTGGVYMVAARSTNSSCASCLPQAFVVREREEDTWWLLVAWDPSASR